VKKNLVVRTYYLKEERYDEIPGPEEEKEGKPAQDMRAYFELTSGLESGKPRVACMRCVPVQS
jgi:hypothetical protein